VGDGHDPHRRAAVPALRARAAADEATAAAAHGAPPAHETPAAAHDTPATGPGVPEAPATALVVTGEAMKMQEGRRSTPFLHHVFESTRRLARHGKAGESAGPIHRSH
jgi:hypothetical protein